jgi:putative cell wall-binding protein/endo-1,4-beta-D-glucanase Y
MARKLRLVGGATVALVAILVAGAGVAPASAAPAVLATGVAHPFGSHPVDFAGGSAVPPGGTAAADAATAAAYERWKANYLVAGCGDGRYYVDASSATGAMVVSEGQGYGMVITALMAGTDPDARAEFDGLHRYAEDHPSDAGSGMMAWQQGADCASIPGSSGSATDGDLDIAYGLLLADAQWGSGGAIDYAAEARERIAGIKATSINPQTLLPKLGDWPAAGSSYFFATRTSDLMIDHFIAFENATGDPFWGQVARASTALAARVQTEFSPGTGLLPDFVVNTDSAPAPAPPGFLESAHDGDFNWNALRTPWRFAAGALLGGDAASAAIAGRMVGWAAASTGGDLSTLRAGYRLDGTPLESYSDLAFIAPMAAGAMTDARRQSIVDDVWGLLTAAQPGGYFTDTVALQVMLLVSGNAWPPPFSAPSSSTRIGGADRFAVSAAVSASTFAPGVDTVYVASGEVFPDALSASAAAAAQGAPVLLVQRAAIPAAVGAELVRLAPSRIVVLGGPATVGAEVVAALAAYGAVERVGGADRYGVSAAISAATFDPGGRVAYVASGEVFPDALAGSAAAGAEGAPVLLTQKNAVPTSVADELRRLAPARIVLLGGPNTVSAAALSTLATVAPVTRVSGADRFGVAASISAGVFDPARSHIVYVASGAVFPDALSASAVAAANHGPVLLITRDTVPAATAAELDRLSPGRIVILGGPNTVSETVATQLATHLAP